MVEEFIKHETKRILLDLFPNDPAAAIDYCFTGMILDMNKCRIALIKRFYYSQIDDTTTCAEAKIRTAEKFCISEKTVENLIYNDYYKAIQI